jgi:hypothetical protein
MRQDNPYAGFERVASVAPAASPASSYAGFQPASPRPAQPRPQAAPMPSAAPDMAPAPASVEPTIAEIYAAQRAQGYTDAQIAANLAEFGMDPNAGDPGMATAQPAAPAAIPSPLDDLRIHRPEFVDMDAAAALSQRARSYTGPGSSAENPFVLRPDDESTEYRDALQSLSRGMYVATPEGVRQLSGDPYINENPDANDTRVGQAVLREENLADQGRAFAMGAAEQIPLLDEAAVAAAGAISGRGYSDTRDSYQALQAIDNQVNRDQRVAGGLSGFALTAAIPGGSGVRYIGQGATRGAQLARAMQIGAGSGAVYGAGAAEGGAEDRLRGAAYGAALGGASAGVLKAGAPYVAEGARRLGSGFSEAGSVLSRGFGRVAPDAEITPEATTSARQYLARLLETSGADLANNPTAALGKPITAAEAIGPSGIANMAALTRRAGRAGNMAQSQLGARAVEQPNRVVQDFADLTGMDPAGSADMIQNLATAGRARAAPLYDAAYARPGAVRSPLIDDLLTRPATRDAMRRAVKIAANEGRDPNTMGFQFDEAGDVIRVQEPSMETLDYVKRGLDDVVNTYRDSTTRRLNLDAEGQSVDGIRRQLRDELVRLNPAYGEALSAGGDPLRLEEAFRLSDRLFQVGTPQRTFAAATQGMGDAERNALVAGFADRLFRDAQAGRLSTRQLNQLNVPVTREKLASLIGAEGADSFMQRIGAEIELARSGGRMAPGTNSVTAEALAAMAEQDGNTGFTADLARNIAQGRGDVVGALALTLGKAAVAPATGFARGMTVSKPQAVRDEIARLLLLTPDELQAELTAVAGSSTPKPDALGSTLVAGSAPQSGQVGAGFAQSEPRRARPEARRAQQ